MSICNVMLMNKLATIKKGSINQGKAMDNF